MAPDGTLLVNDFSTASAALWQFQPDLSSSNLVLDIIGQNAGVTAGIHGDMFGTPQMTGSLEEGNLVLWTADGRLPGTGDCDPGAGDFGGSYNACSGTTSARARCLGIARQITRSPWDSTALQGSALK